MFLADLTSPQVLPNEIPIFPLSGATLLPRCQLPLNIFEPRYVAMLDDALKSQRLIGMVQPDGYEIRDIPTIYRVGCLGRITSFSETEDRRYLLTLSGVTRFEIARELEVDTPYRQVFAHYDAHAHDFVPLDDPEFVGRDALVNLLKPYFKARSIDADWRSMQHSKREELINMLSIVCPFRPEEKQALLEANSLDDREATLTAILQMSATPEMGDDSVN